MRVRNRVYVYCTATQQWNEPCVYVHKTNIQNVHVRTVTGCDFQDRVKERRERERDGTVEGKREKPANARCRREVNGS